MYLGKSELRHSCSRLRRCPDDMAVSYLLAYSPALLLTPYFTFLCRPARSCGATGLAAGGGGAYLWPVQRASHVGHHGQVSN